MLTLHITLNEHDGTHTYQYNRQWRTRRGAENYRDKQIARYGYTPEQFTITGKEEPRRTSQQADPKGKLKIGDILHASWGYNMSLNDFYEVTGISPTGKTCTLRHLANITVSGDPYAPGGAEVRPATGEHRFKGDPIERKRVKAFRPFHRPDNETVCVTIDSTRTAFLLGPGELERGGFYEDHMD